MCLGGIKKVLGSINDDVFKAATGLCGGVAGTGNLCGAVSGGIMALSVYVGREYSNFADPGQEMQLKNRELAKKFLDRFESEFEGITCREVQKKLMGRSFDFYNEKDLAEWEASDAHENKCPIPVGKSARWVVEILLREGYLKV
jgi:C_GCAxxG_C_C family probable redox protein